MQAEWNPQFVLMVCLVVGLLALAFRGKKKQKPKEDDQAVITIERQWWRHQGM